MDCSRFRKSTSMGKSDNLHFEFENEQGVYIPGQAVRGRLHVTLSQATNVRGKQTVDGNNYFYSVREIFNDNCSLFQFKLMNI